MQPARLLPVLALAVTLSAHDFYILPDSFKVGPRSYIEVAFHNGDSFPGSEASPSLARLKDAQLRSTRDTVEVKNLRVDGKRAIGKVQTSESSGSLLLSARTAQNFIELAPDKFLAYIKEEGLTSVIEWRSQHKESSKPGRERYSKFAKSLLVAGAPDDLYKQAIGFPIEIVPETNPYSLHAGSALPVRVLFRGKPATHLQLEAAWAGNGKSKTTVVGRTDKEGRIRVRIPEAGKWRLHTLVMERCADPTVADWESYWASLTFETP